MFQVSKMTWFVVRTVFKRVMLCLWNIAANQSVSSYVSFFRTAMMIQYYSAFIGPNSLLCVQAGSRVRLGSC